MCDPRQELRNATRTVRKITGNIAANVESIARNPLPMLATLALTTAGVPAPIANAAVTVANGGDMNDIIKSAATAYAAQGIGKATGDLLPSDYQTTDPQYALQENIRQIVTSASGSAAVAAIQNRPLSEVLAAATSGAVSSVVRQELMDQGINPGDVSSKLLSSSISAATNAILTGKDWTQAVGQSLATVGIQTSISTGIDYLRNLSTTNDALVSDYNDARDEALRLRSSASMAVNDRNASAYKYNEYLQYVNNFATETERAVDMQTRLGNMAQTGDFSGITSAERDIINQWYGGDTENWVLNQYRGAQAQIQGYNDRMPDMLNDLSIRKTQYDSAETDFNKKNAAYEDSLAFVNGLADQITSNANLITEKTQEIADLTAQYNTSVAADIEKYLGTQAANEITKTLNTSNDTAKEIVAGTQQLVNAITNPDSTASYTGTNVADVSGGITGLPTEQPTEQDYEQLGVGLPTPPEEPFGGIEALTPELNVGTAAPPVSAGIDALIPQVTEFVPTYTEAPVGYQETPLPGNGYQQTVPETTTTGIETLLPPAIEPTPEPVPTYTEAPVGYQEEPAGIESLLPQVPEPMPEPVAVNDGTTSGIEDLISQITPPVFEGIDMTGGQTDTYQAGNEEEPNVPTLPDNTQVEPKVTPEVPAQPSIPQVADDYTTAGIQDIINQLPGGAGMDETDYSGFEGIDMTGGQGDTYQASNTEEPNTITVMPDGNVDANGNPTYVDITGNPVNADGTPIGAAGTTTIGGNSWFNNALNSVSKATGLSPTTLKWLGAGLGSAGLASLLGQQQKAPAPTPYTGPLKNIQYNPATYTPYTYKPYAGGGAVESMSNANAIGANTGYPMADIQRGAYATPYQQPISQNVVTGASDTRVDPYTGEELFAGGGIATLGGYSDGGRLLRGPGDGVSDSIPAMIGNKQPARLADGEFVIPARIVSEIGNGSTDAGARKLYEMMDRVQAARRKTMGKDKFAKNTKADKYLPT